MSPLTLTLKAAVAQPVDASRLSPTGLAGLAPAEIERLPLRVGNRSLPLAELRRAAGRGRLRRPVG